jgi:polysaccharide deacetylase family protein (PEP-CTERM system associated)
MSSTEIVTDDPPAVLTIDVEDWFHVENLAPAIPRESWTERRLRVERNTDRLLQLIAESNGDTRCTCFILGWVADRCPDLVRRVAAAGHEIASHGYGHESLHLLSPQAFRADVQRSKGLLEDIAGTEIRGYRAPSFSITDWALSILQEVGFSYDSSLFPSFGHDRYGKLSGITVGEPLVEISPGFYEVPVSCIAVGSRGLPWGGGGYFRLLPYSVFRSGARRILRSGRPYVFYIHPWEIDPEQPRITEVQRLYRFRHYVGLKRSEARLTSLLKDFSWTTMVELLDGWRSGRHREPS